MARKLEVEFIGDTKNLERAFGRVQSKGSNTFGSLAKGAAGALAGVASFEALKRGVGAAVGEFEEARKVGAQTTAVLKSTGGAAKTTADEVSNLAGAISKKVGIDDEAIQSGANLLLTFKNIRNETGKGNDVFNQATMAMTDLSVAMGQDSRSSAIMLGKALNDPIRGLTAMRRVGIQFTEQQEKQIQTLVKSGDTLGAQKIILKELESQFGGSAAAQATALDKAKVSASNLAEASGALLAPALDRAANAASGLFNGMVENKGVGGALVSTFRDIGNGVTGLVTAFQQGDTAARGLVAGLAAVAAGFIAFRVITTVIAGVAALRAAWIGLTTAMATNPIGAIAIAVTGLVAALGVMSINTRDASASTRDLTVSLNAQADAMRAVRDIDIDVAQRKANLKSANVAVAQSERTLASLRKDGKRGTLEYRQAESSLEQAKVSQRRATRDLGDAEEDSKRKKQAATAATKDARDKTAELIAVRQREITKLESEIKQRIRAGASTAEQTKKVESLRQEIARLKSKQVSVKVDFKLNPAPQAPGANGQSRPGDGWGVENSIQQLAQNAMNSGDLFGGLGAAVAGGSGLNAFNALATQFGLTVGSGFRPGSITSSGNQSYHALGRARDFPGTPAAMMAFAQFMARSYGSTLKELIYTPLGFSIKNGQRVPPYAQADHFDHVHVAMRKGGSVPGSGPGDKVPAMLEPGEFVVRKAIVDKFGPTFFSGLNGMKNGGIVDAVRAGRAAGWTGENLVKAVAIAGAESRFDPRAHAGPNAIEDSRGFWQVNTYAHPWARSMNLYNPTVNAKAAHRVWADAGGFGPWSTWPSAAGGWMDRARAAVTGNRGGKSGGGGGPKTSGAQAAFGNSQNAARQQAAGAVGVATHRGDKGSFGGGKVGAGAIGIAPHAMRSEDAPTALDYFDAAIAKAALTPGTEDDLAALNAQKGHWERALATALGTADPRDDTEAAQGLTSTLEAIESLTGALEAEKRSREEHTAALKSVGDEMKRQTDLAKQYASTSEFQKTKFLADILSGQFGRGIVGRSFTPGTGVEVAY